MTNYQRFEFSATVGGFSKEDAKQMPTYFHEERNLHVPFALSDQLTAVHQAFSAGARAIGFEAYNLPRDLTMDEGIKNLLYHGNKCDPTLESHCRLSIEVRIAKLRKTVSFVLALTDHSPTFEIEMVPDPTADENLEIAKGRGIALMQTFGVNISQMPHPGGKTVMYTWNEVGDVPPPPDIPLSNSDQAD
jgi:hypothetical protein